MTSSNVDVGSLKTVSDASAKMSPISAIPLMIILLAVDNSGPLSSSINVARKKLFNFGVIKYLLAVMARSVIHSVYSSIA